MSKSRPLEPGLEERRPDCRRFVCDGCSKAVYLCSWCDRGHRYCGGRCRRLARRRSLREAGQRYQLTARGRRLHARRQRAYRERRRKKVTHHSCPLPNRSARVLRCAPTSVSICTASSLSALPSRPAATELRCSACGEECEPVIRHDFLRQRRRRRRARESSGDLSRALSGDSPAV